MNLLFFLFCFLNLYGPLSTDITLAFNVILFLSVFSNRRSTAWERPFVLIPVLLLVLSIAAVINTQSSIKDYSIIGIYIRLLTNCITFPVIIYYFYHKNTRILPILALTLFLHCLMVLIQMPYPSLQDYNTVLFRFNREEEILENLTLRRLGLTGGYDVSGLYAALSAFLSIELFFKTSKRVYIYISIISLLSSFFTSRTGMAFAFLLLLFSILLNNRGKAGKKVFSFIYVVILFLSLFYFILPLILNTLGVSTNLVVMDITDSGYGQRTGENLFVYHLLPLESLNNNELIWGYGCGLRKARLWYSSDIGYVKQIFQVGIVGVSLMVIFSLLMSIKTYRRGKQMREDTEMKVGSRILNLLLFVYLVFNYKNYLLFNVCSFEVFLIIYYYHYCYFIHKGELKEKVSLLNNNCY